LIILWEILAFSRPFRCLQNWRNTKKNIKSKKTVTIVAGTCKIFSTGPQKMLRAATKMHIFISVPFAPLFGALLERCGEGYGPSGRLLAPNCWRLLVGTSVSGVREELKSRRVRGGGVFFTLTHPTGEILKIFRWKKGFARGEHHAQPLYLRLFFWVLRQFCKHRSGKSCKIYAFWLKACSIWGFGDGSCLQDCRPPRRISSR